MTKVFLFIALVGFLIIIGPIATIWSLNTLFPVLAIPYSFNTWLSALILAGVVGGTTGVSFKK